MMIEQTEIDAEATAESGFREGPDGVLAEGGVDVVIARETRRIMGEKLAIPHLDPAIDAEAERLQQLAETLASELENAFRRQWQITNPGFPPALSDTLAMRQAAWDQARAEVLAAELYPRVTPEILAQIEETDAMITAMVERTIAERRARKDPDRWKDFHVDVTALAYRIVDRVWLHTDGAFRVRAQCLVQQRLEDNQRTPATAADPITEVLEAMINAQIAVTPADRLPF